LHVHKVAGAQVARRDPAFGVEVGELLEGVFGPALQGVDLAGEVAALPIGEQARDAGQRGLQRLADVVGVRQHGLGVHLDGDRIDRRVVAAKLFGRHQRFIVGQVFALADRLQAFVADLIGAGVFGDRIGEVLGAKSPPSSS
jgi:hypothetical protein